MFDIDSPKAQKILTSYQIPVKPQILADIQREEMQPEPSAAKFAEIITHDPGLSSAVLKSINSPVFGLKRTVTDIKQSVMLLGCKNISNLVSFFELQKAFDTPSAISNELFWDKSVDIANIMTHLIEQLSLKATCPIEDAYAFGLFRDCGIVIMAQKYPNYAQVLNEAETTEGKVFTEIEEAYYPINHAVLGYYVSSSWHLPIELCQLILRHHELDFLKSNDVTHQQKTLYALAKLATNIYNNQTKLVNSAEWIMSKEDVLSFLSLSDLDLQELEDDIEEILLALDS